MNVQQKITKRPQKSLVQNIIAIDNEAEATNYMRNFFGDNQALINEFIRKRFPKSNTGGR